MRPTLKKLQTKVKGLRLKINKQGELIDQYGRILLLNSKGDIRPSGRCTVANH